MEPSTAMTNASPASPINTFAMFCISTPLCCRTFKKTMSARVGDFPPRRFFANHGGHSLKKLILLTFYFMAVARSTDVFSQATRNSKRVICKIKPQPCFSQIVSGIKIDVVSLTKVAYRSSSYYIIFTTISTTVTNTSQDLSFFIFEAIQSFF